MKKILYSKNLFIEHPWNPWYWVSISTVLHCLFSPTSCIAAKGWRYSYSAPRSSEYHWIEFFKIHLGL